VRLNVLKNCEMRTSTAWPGSVIPSIWTTSVHSAVDCWLEGWLEGWLKGWFSIVNSRKLVFVAVISADNFSASFSTILVVCFVVVNGFLVVVTTV